ncbi:RagB/SusD family nutrient uptake outer membrane protein [Deminuibacter soli]|uniref:RagB/SusD family nutrient uptake outer membrane protein n=1 Tax=Deminuibacter soli TaxID=2291815 RepID=A0A3E1NGT3_9BACT|nr:RagB/SusD family nutrient uptake outer membrane protein [Deminuibacter soli]RFM27160.1 RagB/SusD family nutrient uptake outer membrane protein [Deminuibacter soli]
MKRTMYFPATILLALACCMWSCKKDYGNLNSPTAEQFLNNASKSELNNLVSGTESGMRNNAALYLDDVGTIGREGYRFSGSEPRYVTDLLGANSGTLSSSNFYITTPWASHYRVIKNCNILIQSAANATTITDAEKKGYSGFAKTIKAYQLLLNLNLTDSNGIRIDVNDPDHLGPIVGYDAALTTIALLLDSAKTDLTGAAVSFPLAGFGSFSDAAGLVQFNRSLAARVAVYRQQWASALTYLNDSFFSLNGDFNTGVNHVFGTGSGDQLNPAFIPLNQAGEIRVAHPSYATDITPGDDRINKAPLRNATASLNGLSSNRDVWVYTSSTAPMPIIRNEELILIYAEAKIALNSFPDAIVALNVIRTKHNLPAYAGAVTQNALTTEMLNQRRYSLFYEGHRWVDMRRYNRLGELPIDRPGDDVWTMFPLPVTEN